MRTLSDTDCLNLWDHGANRHTMDRALLVLAAALPEAGFDRLAVWPLGRCNQALAALHCRCFGPVLNGWLACERCDDRLEFELDASSMAGQVPAVDEVVRVNGWTFRLPGISDLAHMAQARQPAAAVHRLLKSCLVAPPHVASWSEADIEAIGASMEAADPLAETRLMFRCASCGHEGAVRLDIAAFVWEQIAARARRTLTAVHTLASAYGWTEAAILSLSEARRAQYVGMVRA